MFGLDGVLENAQGYMDSKIQLVKLEIQDKLTKVITLLLLMISVLFLSMMTLTFLSMALAYFFNSLLNSSYLGFIIMGFLYFALIIIIVLSKNSIHKKILNITSHLMDTHDKQ